MLKSYFECFYFGILLLLIAISNLQSNVNFIVIHEWMSDGKGRFKHGSRLIQMLELQAKIKKANMPIIRHFT